MRDFLPTRCTAHHAAEQNIYRPGIIKPPVDNRLSAVGVAVRIAAQALVIFDMLDHRAIVCDSVGAQIRRTPVHAYQAQRLVWFAGHEASAGGLCR